ncbi:P-type conjugative transfer protein TrbJ [Photobacterium damselae]|uniref:P-type conjugative transfer protein TrbJ n=1 Tax=Photobacterium damselae TaxID=38293 RepID=UPI00143236A9|nr:P-type conjugative transfer protein TrbJ [Photobacterium damselae]
MRNYQKLAYALFSGSLLLTTPAHAFAVVCVNCATNTQALQANIAQAKDYIESVQRTLNSIAQLKNQVTNMTKIGKLEWGDIDDQLLNLSNIASQGQALTLSVESLNREWDNKFQGYDVYRHTKEPNTTEQYQQWSHTLRDTSRNAVQLANQVAQSRQDDNQVVKGIQSHTNNAQGIVQVTQASNELLVQTINALQKVQALLETDIRLTATEISTANDKLDAQKAADDKLFSRDLSKELNYRNGINWFDRVGRKPQ